jgi:HK97 family phage prohead protease
MADQNLRDLRAQGTRTVAQFDARQQSDGSWKLGGYASTFNDPYDVHDRFGTFSETILPGTWDKTLTERGHKIQLLASHDGLPYASTKSKSLRLSTDTHGLEWEARLSADSPRAQDLGVGIRDGYIDEMSVGMRVPEVGDRWSDDMTERHISEATLLEISVVARGANPNTEASMREQELLAEIRELRNLMAQDPVELDDQPVVLDTNIDDLRALLTKREYRVPISKELTALLERRK